MSPGLQNGTVSEDSVPVTPLAWTVQKYGGTSLGKFPEDVADIIRSSLMTQRVAVVCSARSSSSKNEGTTNRLLRAANLARSVSRASDTGKFLQPVQDIHDDHERAARDTIKSPDLLNNYLQILDAECNNVEAENHIISKGEKLACQYISTLLEDRGIPAHYVDLSDVMDRQNIPAKTLENHSYQALASAFRQEILASGPKVPVITGYFGNMAAGLLHRVGRGYSDLTAALCAIGISAQELQIWKEVDGIFTADPRKVPTASLLTSVSPSEAAELTFFGSEVIHPATMHEVMRAHIPIRIKNTNNPSGPGTVIQPQAHREDDTAISKKPAFKLHRGRSSGDLTLLRTPKRPTAVTVKRSVIMLNLHSNKTTRAHGFLSRTFAILDAHNLSVDLIASSEVHISLALHSERPWVEEVDDESIDLDQANLADERLRRACQDLEELGSVDLVTDMAIISLVGQKLKNMIGISGKFFSVLGDNEINVEMISQGASEINISCVIWERDADRALNIVHTHLFTFLE